MMLSDVWRRLIRSKDLRDLEVASARNVDQLVGRQAESPDMAPAKQHAGSRGSTVSLKALKFKAERW